MTERTVTIWLAILASCMAVVLAVAIVLAVENTRGDLPWHTDHGDRSGAKSCADVPRPA